MSQVIVVHANCKNSTAKGDFVFAGNIARDLMVEIAKNSTSDDIDVFLVSTGSGTERFISLYGPVIDDRINVDDISIGLSSLEEFDPFNHTVIAFIDASRCQYSPTEMVKRILSPSCRFLIIANANQHNFSSFTMKTCLHTLIKKQQPGLYDYFAEDDFFYGSAGFGAKRLGFSNLVPNTTLRRLSEAETWLLPQEEYGFMYISPFNGVNDYQLIAQYMKLARLDRYMVVGKFDDAEIEAIKAIYWYDKTLTARQSSMPDIQCQQSLPYPVMRKAVAESKSSLVVATGVNSTLESMIDGKLVYYQKLENNTTFVKTYLKALSGMLDVDSGIFINTAKLIMELSSYLFAQKPLSVETFNRTNTLININPVKTHLIAANQKLIAHASGKIAPKLLSFIQSEQTNLAALTMKVCFSLRKRHESMKPCPTKALRRAACWGKLFELKVLIKALRAGEIDAADPTFKRSPLLWAIYHKNIECARFLVQSGADTAVRDINDHSPMHIAYLNDDIPMIKMLENSGLTMKAVADLDSKEETEAVRPVCT